MTTSQLQKKCAKLLQELGRETFEFCEVCGMPLSCLHHFVKKSQSNRLRYDKDNLIPICNSCHFKIHITDDPSIEATIIRKRGWKWYDQLMKKKHEMVKTNLPYYLKIKEILEAKTLFVENRENKRK